MTCLINTMFCQNWIGHSIGPSLHWLVTLLKAVNRWHTNATSTKEKNGDFQVQDFLPLPEDISVRGVDVSTVPSKSFVPHTVGPTRWEISLPSRSTPAYRDKALIQESCLIAVFWSEKQEQVDFTNITTGSKYIESGHHPLVMNIVPEWFDKSLV